MNNKIIVNYNKSWSKDGTCYSQNVKIDKELIRFFNHWVKYLKVENSYDKMYLKTISLDERVVYTNLTTARYLCKYLYLHNINTDRFLLDRNTRLILL